MDVMEEKQADEGKAERHHFSWDLKGEQESARQRVGEIWAAEAPGGLWLGCIEQEGERHKRLNFQ